MERNVGAVDMILRLVLGVIIIGVGIYFRSWWGLVGIIPIVVALIGYCPLYPLFKWNTNK